MDKPLIPKSLKIGVRTYTVIEWDHQVAMANNYSGLHDGPNSMIKVDVYFDPPEVAEILIHEILHAIFDMAQYCFVENPSEEFIVSFTAVGFTKVLIDNPDLAEYLKLATAWVK